MDQTPEDISALPTSVRRKHLEYFNTTSAPDGPKAPGKQPKRISSPSAPRNKPFRRRLSCRPRYDTDNLPPLAPLLSVSALPEDLPEKVRRLYLSSEEGGIPLRPHTRAAPPQLPLQHPSTSRAGPHKEPLRYKASIVSLPAEAIPSWESKGAPSKLVPPTVRLHQSAPESRRPSDISDRTIIMDDMERRHMRTSSFKRTISLITEAGAKLSPSNPKPLSHRASWRNLTKDAEPLDGPSNYYNDPETRMRLKIWLSSPEKFEEALRYGFPFPNTEPTPSPALSAPPRRSTSSANDAQRFLRNNTLSFLYDSGDDFSDEEDQKAAVVREYEDTLDESSDEEAEETEKYDEQHEESGSASEADDEEADNEDDDDEPISPEIRSPVTPRDTFYTATAEQVPFRRPSEVVWPPSPPRPDPRQRSHPRPEPITIYVPANASIDNAPVYNTNTNINTTTPRFSTSSRYVPREMTLRMTLTKPELRADEERERWQGGYARSKDDPLALQPLAYFENFGKDAAGSTKNRGLWWRRKSKQMR